ncbi:DnaT-like ssDNA-binding domain-containing protein [Phytopseudomonas punonensis]|uniref:DnaT DNA-binding domain-containing protein n=1 Tax=Phytopseudomonas punonensis TaxID=1220495 RepID=A0A1M7LJ62_9GAMM|nr:DnaT-like ssDNA-binding domain-containing protein [Pseudomonas punonensis]SHM78068.1 hypothetical protein SAMN05216288_4278 [Pseudomonas punonensis]
MAGDWIKFELATLDKPEVCQIADVADIDLDAVVGKLLRVWGWFDQQTEAGNAPSVTKKLLDRLVGVSGFCNHMISVGWLIEADGEISIPNFDRHNGKTAKNRSLTALRVASHKKGNGKSNAASVTPPLANALPREEKRRDKEQQQAPTAIANIEARQRFEMFEGWAPDEVSLATHLKLIGITADQVTPEATKEFVSYWLTRDTAHNQAGWCRELVASIKRSGVRAAAAPTARPGRSSQHTDLANQDPHAGLEARTDGSYRI